MTEWGVFGVIVAVVGLIATVTVPMVRLNTTMTRLAVASEQNAEEIEEIAIKHRGDMEHNSESHRRIWEHNKVQDTSIRDNRENILNHEHRICGLEGKEVKKQ